MTPLKLPTTLLHDQANTCLAHWVAQLPEALPPQVVLNAADLVDFDSSALAALLGLRRVLAQKDSALQVVDMSPRLLELARLYGVLDLLQSA